MRQDKTQFKKGILFNVDADCDLEGEAIVTLDVKDATGLQLLQFRDLVINQIDEKVNEITRRN